MKQLPKLLFCVVLLGTTSVGANGIKAEDYVDGVLRCTSNPCIVDYNPGGNIQWFKIAGMMIRLKGQQLVINGDCVSACVIAAEAAKPNACITPKARFGFHKAYELVAKEIDGQTFTEKTNLVDMPVSPRLTKWIKDEGGFPVNKLLWMSYAEARKFWPSCMIDDVPLPSSRPVAAKRPVVTSTKVVPHGLY